MKAAIKQSNEVITVTPLDEERDYGSYLNTDLKSPNRQFDESELRFFSHFNNGQEEDFLNEKKDRVDRNVGNTTMEELDALSYTNKESLESRISSRDQINKLVEKIKFYGEPLDDEKYLIAFFKSDLEKIKDISLADIHNHTLGNSSYEQIEQLSIKHNTFVSNIDINLTQLELLQSSNMKFNAMESYTDEGKYTVYYSEADALKLIDNIFKHNQDYRNLERQPGKKVLIELPDTIKKVLTQNGVNFLDTKTNELGVVLRKDDLSKVYRQFLEQGLQHYYKPKLEHNKRNPIRSR